MNEHRVSFRYARALLETAQEAKSADVVLEDFERVNESFKLSRELRSLTASPVFRLNKKKEIFKELYNTLKVSDLTMDFLQLILDKRRGALIPSIIAEYVTQYNQLNNILPIEVESAVELSEDLKSEILKRLTEKTKQTLQPIFKVNPDLKAGFIVKIDDWMFDASLTNQLKKLYATMANG